MKKQPLPLLIGSLLLAASINSANAGEGHEHPAAEQTAAPAVHNEDSHDDADHAETGEKGAEHESHGDESDDHGEEADEGNLHLNPQQQAMIDLKVSHLKPQLIAETLSVPGEVVFNSYRSSIIAAQADARVMQRHVVLGDHVEKGQPLATLFSDELADRLTDLRDDVKEWELVKKMGRDLAGKQRYSQAQSALNQSLVKVQVFGLSKDDIEAQFNSNKATLGQFVLRAPHKGVVQQDNFLVGQQLSSSDPLFTLVDESEIWVEAQLPADQGIKIPKNTPVQLNIAGQNYEGLFQQLAHNLNENTRTRMARIAVDNSQHTLHPGQFALASLPTEVQQWAFVLPESAFTRTPDGDWGVFVEITAGEYQLKEVEVIREIPGARVIEGLESGTEVVTSGTFFLASEQAKSGFDIHNH